MLDFLLSWVSFDYVLQIVLLGLLSQGFLRKYAILAAYCAVQLILSTIEDWALVHAGVKSSLYTHVYWTDEVILDLLLFLMVIVLTYRALEGNPLKPKVGRVLGAILIAALVLPFLLFYRNGIFGPRWFNHTAQLLNFGGAIMNIALWSALLLNKKRDPRLLTVSAGLGIAVTGAALFYGLRYFNTVNHDWVNLLKTSTHLASMGIWCWAFWPSSERSPRHPAVVAH